MVQGTTKINILKITFRISTYNSKERFKLIDKNDENLFSATKTQRVVEVVEVNWFLISCSVRILDNYFYMSGIFSGFDHISDILWSSWRENKKIDVMYSFFRFRNHILRSSLRSIFLAIILVDAFFTPSIDGTFTFGINACKSFYIFIINNWGPKTKGIATVCQLGWVL